jgi:hypothetical protein
LYSVYHSRSGGYRPNRCPCQRELSASHGTEEREEVGKKERAAAEEGSKGVTKGDEKLEEASPERLLIASPTLLT